MSLAKNRKAYYDYEIIDKFEAGIILNGPEIKSIRNSNLSISESRVIINKGEAWLIGCHVAEYKFDSSSANYDPIRERKLLLHKKQIDRLGGTKSQQGLTIIPLSVYLKRNLVKIEIALARGKKKFDKRASIKEKDSNRDIARVLKNKNN
jgi:SsrA-binding protein|tara:strand:+ start:323 stop:772 length:450 start_codon:yes stop_codon:yes gene_type:complete